MPGRSATMWERADILLLEKERGAERKEGEVGHDWRSKKRRGSGVLCMIGWTSKWGSDLSLKFSLSPFGYRWQTYELLLITLLLFFFFPEKDKCWICGWVQWQDAFWCPMYKWWGTLYLSLYHLCAVSWDILINDQYKLSDLILSAFTWCSKRMILCRKWNPKLKAALINIDWFSCSRGSNWQGWSCVCVSVFSDCNAVPSRQQFASKVAS